MLNNTMCKTFQKSHRERDENYHTVIYHANGWRVIVCSDHIQWIIQKIVKRRAGQCWIAVSYHCKKKSLIRVWHAKTGDYNGAVELGKLSKQIGGTDGL